MIKNLHNTLCVLLLALISIDTKGGDENLVFYAYDGSNGLADNSVQIVQCTKTGRVLIFTIGHVNFFDGDNFTHIDPTERDVIDLPGYQGNYQMFFDKYHHLWGKNRGRLACVDLLTERFISDVERVYKEMGVTKPVDDIYGDHDCNMWFRSSKQLVDPKKEKRFTIQSSSILQHVDLIADSLLMLFHADGSVGVYDYKHPRHLYTVDAFSTANEKQRYAHSSAATLVGNCYYQIRKGEKTAVLMRYDIHERCWTKLFEMPFLMNSIYPKDDQLYIASEQGYLVYSLKTGDVKHYKTITLSKGRTMSPHVNSLMFDRQGGLWMGTTTNGLLYAKAYPSPFVSYVSQSPEAAPFIRMLDQEAVQEEVLPYRVNCLFTDSRGWKWEGTYTGLTLRRPGKADMKFTRRDGLTNEVIHAIVEDDQHHMWISTSYGIARLYVRADSVYHIESYVNKDNVPNDAFLNGRTAKLADGTIVMQSIDHVVVFNPANFRGERFGDISLYPKLVRLMVNGVFIESGVKLDDRVILERSASRTREFHVNYNQNSMSLTFSGLNYLRPMQTYYRVRVKGVPAYDDWRILGFGKSGGLVDRNGMLHLPLTGLNPGVYTVELQTSMWPDKWVVDPLVWTIHVDQPWWRTSGLYIMLVMVLLVLAILNFLYFNRNTKIRIRCLNDENDMMTRLRGFADRCAEMHEEQLTPVTASADNDVLYDNLSDKQAFDKVMLKLIPYVTSHHKEHCHFQEVADVAEMGKGELYVLLANHIDKNPRLLISKLRVQEAAQLLSTTDMSVEDIADTLHYSSPNYFVTSFYHHYHVTPRDYRNSTAR